MRPAPPLRSTAFLYRFARNLVEGSKSQILCFDNPNFETLPSNQKIEEEVHGATTDGRYYPMRIGDVLHDQYQVVGKLGYGLGSTVWLANHLRGTKPVTLKVFTNDRQNQEEINIYRHLMSVQSKHPGRKHLRSAIDNFTLYGPKGEHQCLVHEPMLETMNDLLDWDPRRQLTTQLLKLVLQYLLSALDFLHREAKMIHTDISAWNILLRIEDESLIQRFIQAEQESPSSRKEVQGYTVYTSRGFDNPSGKCIGLPLLSDLGAAVSGTIEHDNDVQPNVYRAPEVCLKIWDLFEGKHMFYGHDPEKKKYMTRAHLAEMIALMGPPPLDLLEKGKRTAEFFDQKGEHDSLRNTFRTEFCRSVAGRDPCASPNNSRGVRGTP
ncbi:MAG: hypothetical protein Q9219_006812 [cf. Caloplaca sp. 3 TL-2023]